LSFTQFSFDPRIADAIKQIGYTVPTPIQEQGIPVVLEGRDMLGLAQTGTGKTASFLLPLLQRLMLGRMGRIRALILAPTRELAEQIHQAAVDLAKVLESAASQFMGVSESTPRWGLFGGVLRSWSPARDDFWTTYPGEASISRESRCWFWTRPTGCATWDSFPT